MQEIIKPPEILNPYNLKPSEVQDKSFVDDLKVQLLINAIPFNSSDTTGTKALAQNVLTLMPCDIDTARYRQDILDDLISNKILRENVRSCVKKNLLELSETSFYFSKTPTFSVGIPMLRLYKGLICNPPDFSAAKSKALKDVCSFLKAIKTSEEFSQLCDFIDTIANRGSVTFRVYLDDNGQPMKMSTFELLKGEPKDKSRLMSFITKVFGGKPYEESLLLGVSHNEAGRVIQSSMQSQFLPVIEAYFVQIKAVTSLLNPLDFYAGIAEYFVKLKERGFDICRPALLPMYERKMAVINARNPLLLEAKNDGSKVISNDITYTPDKNMFVITGPNNGGKTTYVTTIGLIQLMSQKGLFVPAESAEVSFVDCIYTHFVSPDDITKGEGRYRNELRRIKDILEVATPYSLVILDEPCGGTSYEEGCRQSLVLLDGFHQLGTTTYFTTHMHPVATEIETKRFPAARNLSVESRYDGKKLVYTYKVREGASGKSYGEEIAKEVGLVSESIEKMLTKRADKEGYADIIRK